MYNTFMEGKDLYSEIASKAFNFSYLECLEHFPKDTPIKKKGDRWYYATLDDYDKLADGETDTYKDGKERRTQAKSILLGALYGRGVDSIAEQLHCSSDKAEQIKASVFKGFPAIKKFEDESCDMCYDLGYVTTIAGRKRRLPDYQLHRYTFRWVNGVSPYDDPLDFNEIQEDIEVPHEKQTYYLNKLNGRINFQARQKIFEEANKEGIWIDDNFKKISQAQRQIVNSRIQGSAADLTKLAMIALDTNEELRNLGFRLLIPVHDEVIAKCPLENAKECARLLAETMSKAAEKMLEMPIKCDVTISREWYGEELNLGD